MRAIAPTNVTRSASSPSVAGRDRPGEQATSLRFAAAVRALGLAARSAGWAVPAFRSPPRLPGVDRSLRRRVDGGATVSVRLRPRPWPAVLADMIDGLVAANGLAGAEAASARSALWGAAQASGLVDAPATEPSTGAAA